MDPMPASLLHGWRAHVGFDAGSGNAAWRLRETIATALADRLTRGRFDEKSVGSHPMWGFQLAFGAAEFAPIVGWLALSHGALRREDVSTALNGLAPWTHRHAAAVGPAGHGWTADAAGSGARRRRRRVT